MTPRYQWTPASEPPDTARDVAVWDNDSGLWTGWHHPRTGEWRVYGAEALIVTHWRDVEPPDVEAQP